MAADPREEFLRLKDFPQNYTAGQQIVVTVRLNQAGRASFGFQLTAIGGNGQSAGTIELIEPQRTQLKNSSAALNAFISNTLCWNSAVEWSGFMDVQMDSAGNQHRAP